MKLRNKNTGEDGRLGMCHDGNKYPLYIEATGCRIYYHDFSEMLEAGWECYIDSKEPVIKSENMRKLIRAWAEFNSIEKVLYAERPDRSLWCLTDMGDDDFSIQFVGWMPTLKDGREYTIDELCGRKNDLHP